MGDLLDNPIAQIVAHIAHKELLEVGLALAVFHIWEVVSHHQELSDAGGHPLSFSREVVLVRDDNLLF